MDVQEPLPWSDSASFSSILNDFQFGHCLPPAGGALALLAAEHVGVDAAVSFYGKPDPRMGSVSHFLHITPEPHRPIDCQIP